ncbi:LytTR family DNA-binding domain-containing protein [Spirosoma sp. SC4-14]|uniref:LytR/AlgR family response regulator transcription factor n=1 Tax=Spirosoma sp. SC4-14 TaxID=3128900 RepID=UPI0030D595D1
MTIHNCLLIEDSEFDSKFLSHQLQQIGLFEIDVCKNLEDATIKIREKLYDLIFLDINLSAESGLAIFDIFDRLPPVIIHSSYSEYAAETYDIDSIVDFLVKPIEPKRLKKALNRALANRFAENSIIEKDFAFFKVARKVMRFDYEHISYITAYGVYSKIFYKNQVTLVNEPISVLEKVLPRNQFRRVHKSYIINIHKVTGFDHKSFYVGNDQIPIGISYRPQLEGLFRLFGSTD